MIFNASSEELRRMKLNVLELLNIDLSSTPRVIFHHTTSGSAIKILQTETLRFSPPKKLNDPFDIDHKIIQFDQGETTDTGETPEELFKRAKNIIGICCFTKRFNNPLMWSHYSNKHQGVVLGFNLEVFYNEVDIIPVAYLDKRPTVHIWNDDYNPFTAIVLVKSKVWKYEKEVRAISYTYLGKLISPNEIEYYDFRPMTFKKSSLEEVYFGINTNRRHKKAILKTLITHNYNSDLKVHNMLMNEDYYRFDKSECKLLNYYYKNTLLSNTIQLQRILNKKSTSI